MITPRARLLSFAPLTPPQARLRCAIMLAWVACGRLSAYFEADLNAWDTAAGVLLVREAGGVVTDLSGGEFGIAT